MYWFSDRIALKMSKAQPVSEAGGAERTTRTCVSCRRGPACPMPRLYVIPAEQPNAFATGRNPVHSAVAVTNGLLEQLPREQMRGVLAHELAHIRNRDVLVSTIAAVIAGAVSAIANFLQFSLIFGGGDDDESPLGFAGALATIIIAPLAAMLLQLGVSRQREYLADRTGAELLGDGRPLADALESIHAKVAVAPMAGQPGDRGALHHEPAERAGSHGSLLDASSGGGACPPIARVRGRVHRPGGVRRLTSCPPGRAGGQRAPGNRSRSGPSVVRPGCGAWRPVGRHPSD